jgi:hypothetical protein
MQLRASSTFCFRYTAAAFVTCALSACSSSTGATPPGDPGATAVPTDPGPASGAGEDAGAAPEKCSPAPAKSACKNESSWVRGVAHFDPSRLKAGSKPILRVVLRHGFIFVKGEEAIGGRLHAWESFPIEDPSKGELPFAIDMCGMGTAMWSEENSTFHLVLILDEDGNNDIDDARSNEEAIIVGIPGANELAKMVDVDVSCHAPSACLDVTLDCVGPSCTTITPITKCTKKTPGCPSDDKFCK